MPTPPEILPGAVGHLFSLQSLLPFKLGLKSEPAVTSQCLSELLSVPKANKGSRCPAPQAGAAEIVLVGDCTTALRLRDWLVRVCDFV